MQDAYAGLNRLYLSMHTPGEVAVLHAAMNAHIVSLRRAHKN